MFSAGLFKTSDSSVAYTAWKSQFTEYLLWAPYIKLSDRPHSWMVATNKFRRSYSLGSVSKIIVLVRLATGPVRRLRLLIEHSVNVGKQMALYDCCAEDILKPHSLVTSQASTSACIMLIVREIENI
jgi:hypothetical protein